MSNGERRVYEQRGLWYEELEIGALYRHSPGRTVSEADNILFSTLTMNPQALHLDGAWAAQQPFGQRLVNSLFTLSTLVGLSVAQLTQGTIVANLGFSDVTFPKPVATIYVGNPSIADINMIDSRHAFILGKGYGNTNMLALDQDGKQVSNTHISVLARQDASVTLQRGANRSTYACSAAHCEVAPQPGDGKETFDSANSQISAHANIAKTAANAQ